MKSKQRAEEAGAIFRRRSRFPASRARAGARPAEVAPAQGNRGWFGEMNSYEGGEGGPAADGARRPKISVASTESVMKARRVRRPPHCSQRKTSTWFVRAYYGSSDRALFTRSNRLVWRAQSLEDTSILQH